jgi:hypothetical protein
VFGITLVLDQTGNVRRKWRKFCLASWQQVMAYFMLNMSLKKLTNPGLKNVSICKKPKRLLKNKNNNIPKKPNFNFSVMLYVIENISIARME